MASPVPAAEEGSGGCDKRERVKEAPTRCAGSCGGCLAAVRPVEMQRMRIGRECGENRLFLAYIAALCVCVCVKGIVVPPNQRGALHFPQSNAGVAKRILTKEWRYLMERVASEIEGDLRSNASVALMCSAWMPRKGAVGKVLIG